MLAEREPFLNRDPKSDILSSKSNNGEGVKTTVSNVFGHVKFAKTEKQGEPRCVSPQTLRLSTLHTLNNYSLPLRPALGLFVLFRSAVFVVPRNMVSKFDRVCPTSTIPRKS